MALRAVNKGLKWWQFIPWVVTLAFILLVVGLAIWVSKSNTMVSLTASALDQLGGISVEASIKTWSKAWIGWMATLYALMAIASMVIAVMRRIFKVTSDDRGYKAQVTRSWLICHSVVIVLWWLLLLLLLLIIVGQTAWLVTAWAIDKAALVGATSVERSMNASAISPPASSPSPLSPWPSPGLSPPSSNATGGSPVSGNRTSPSTTGAPTGSATSTNCSATCVDLSAFVLVLGTGSASTCICNLTRIHLADAQMTDAMNAVSGSTGGAVLMFVAASWMLMGAASDYGATRRELVLGKALADAQAAAEGRTMTKKTSFFKRGKKAREHGSGDGTGGAELETISDIEEGEGGHVTTDPPGTKTPPDKGGGGKGGAKGGGAKASKAPDEVSLLGGKKTSSDGTPPRSWAERSSASFAGVQKNISSSFTGAMSSAKKGSTKLFAKALKLGF